MKIKVKVKSSDAVDDANGLDIKKAILNAIKEAEQKHSNLELVHVSGNPKNHLRIYNLEEESYTIPKKETAFLNTLNEELIKFGYKAYIFDKSVVIDVFTEGKVDVIKEEKSEPEEREEESQGESEDTRYRYGAVTARKLEIFLERYRNYLRDESAELNYNRSKDKWGPRFGYKRDEAGAPDEAMRDEIREYVNQTFYE